MGELATDADEGDLVLEKFVLQLEPIKVFEKKSRFQGGQTEFKRDDVTRHGRLREFQPGGGGWIKCEVVLSTAFFQGLETFVESAGFFGPCDEAAEAFVVNGPIVDFAIRSNWA